MAEKSSVGSAPTAPSGAAGSPGAAQAASRPGAQPAQDAGMAQAGNQVGTAQQVSPQNIPNTAQANRSAQAVQSGQTLQSSGPNQTPQWQDSNPGSASEQTQKAGQALHNSGVTTNEIQSAETKAQMQNALDNSAKNGQNGPGQGSRLDAAQQEAKSASQSQAPSQSMER